MNLDIKSLRDLPVQDAAECLAAFVEALVQVNGLFLRRNPSTVKLYTAHIVYEDRPDWQDVPAMLLSRRGDCKSLCAWRIAELRESGQEAFAHVVFIPKVKEDLFHFQVRRAGGKMEDPSRFLGMRE